MERNLARSLVERSLSERDVELAIMSRRSLIGRYFHIGQERIGFWHPNTGAFVAWKPTPPTRIVSAFERHDGGNYFRSLDAEPSRR